jgi:hypothetical protein
MRFGDRLHVRGPVTTMTRFTREASATDALVAETDSISLQRIDEAAGLGRPGGLGVTNAEREFESIGHEQEESWLAEGEAAARTASVRAARYDEAVIAGRFLLTDHSDEVTSARQSYQHAAQTLMPYVRRSPADAWRYGAGWALLGLGDTAGVWGAAIWLGEIPLIALGQALATGFAAVTAGLAGGELQELRQARARRRDPDSLSPDERQYQRLFVEADAGLGLTKIVGGVSLTVVVLVAIGVFALRAGTEGLLAGVTFGALAAATALGSFVSSYVHGDEVADLIGSYRKRYDAARRRHRGLARNRDLSRHASAVEESTSIWREHDARGRAAAQKVTALKYRMLRRNPQVVGHGEATTQSSGLIGRRARKDGAA